MTLPQIVLDDRDFQQLVSEARLRIGARCPEWTEHNVSDPGITLVEAFAWMTDMLIYRLNRVPDKVHVALLELLGIELGPPTAATTDLRFRLGAPAAQPIRIPAHEAQAGTRRTPSEESIVFSTQADFTIPALRLASYQLQRAGKLKDIGAAAGQARPVGQDRLAFGSPPAAGDALYLGFDDPLASLLVRVYVEGSRARGAGVDPEDPPLRWEVSATNDEWAEVSVLADRTGGFNYGTGTIELELPPNAAAGSVGGTRMHWLRCRLDSHTRSGAEGSYSQPPEIDGIEVAAVGARLPAMNAELVTAEVLGESDGSRGQTFRLRRSPVVAPEPGERLQVLEREAAEWVDWTPCPSFVESAPDDRHYRLDAVAGEISFGPAIRLPDGNWREFGAVPGPGAALRFTRYRHGGGRGGNVAADTLRTLKSAIPGIEAVTNPEAAVGGVDPESLDSARERAGFDLRTRHRAVTAADYEFLCTQASQKVARAACLEPAADGVIPVRLLPKIENADRYIEPHELRLPLDVRQHVQTYLDERRMIGTTVELGSVGLRAVTVVVALQSLPDTDAARLSERVEAALYRFLNPLVGGSPTGRGSGWEFGRALNQGELYGVVRAVAGVEFVTILRVYETDFETGLEQPKPISREALLELAPDEVIVSGRHRVRVESRGE
ncbi:MAG: putative baseplate assembly protein [Gaiellales bacterium]